MTKRREMGLLCPHARSRLATIQWRMNLAAGRRRFVPTNEGMNNPQYLMMFLLHPLSLTVCRVARLSLKTTKLTLFLLP